MRTRDGIEIRGETAEDQARELHKMSYAPAATDAEFRYQMAGRALLQTGRKVRCDTAENFIADLVAIGILIEE